MTGWKSFGDGQATNEEMLRIGHAFAVAAMNRFNNDAAGAITGLMVGVATIAANLKLKPGMTETEFADLLARQLRDGIIEAITPVTKN